VPVFGRLATPGVDAVALQQLIAQLQNQAGGSFLGLFDLFSGGALQYAAVGRWGLCRISARPLYCSC
jgi:preprotein translocase subunit SecY